ncbi:hypothetical protein FRB94_010290 [Tulasnella sp. JGI-2019a]|nr:hypothetical protein FRB94_010290 [Tulasnella sp. JGI-2019a]KAG9012342.1 hypothetical protein FRB93_001764 [Tulasnella sp. JGI-2019a]KAG9036157.1 hypothetical protein FRB95_009731 [Tulasnella sp. JGI-2019a]
MAPHALASEVTSDLLNIKELFKVDGWVVIVTGGSTGLGLVTATALAANGAKVYITGRRAEALEKAVTDFAAKHKSGNGAIIAIQGDASNKEGVDKLVKEFSAKEKHLNVLINNHGVSLPHANINGVEQTAEALSKEMYNHETFERWLDCYAINTASYYFTTFALLPFLAAAKTVAGHSEPGNVVNIASMSGITRTSQRGQFSYNTSKAATISLSTQLATEFARRGLGIRVNVICPGYFPSGMTVIDPEDNKDSHEHVAKFKDHWGIPFGRPGGAVDYAQCIFSLITNRYTTGAEFIIDGGWLLQEAF